MDAFNRIALRRLYNKGNVGRGQEGVTSRASLHTTITYGTFVALGNVIPLKKGGYAAPVVELGIRLILALVGSAKVETVGEEFFHAVLPVRSTVVDNLRKMADYIEAYKPD